MQSEILSFKDSFEKMIETKEVDLNVIPIINKLKEEVLKKREFAIEQNLPEHSLFPVYHSTSICNKVLESISTRLVKAKENKDNPIIAEDTLAIYPSFFMLTTNLDRTDLRSREINTFHLLNLASNLQISAIRSNLFKTDGDTKKEVLEKAKEVICDLKIEGITNDKLQGAD
ncbi:MAG: hypothetical protein AABW67_02285 [Nanoarchaeota archaeon]